MSRPLEILKRYFGYDSFRANQAEIVDAILEGRDVLAIMPTGAGKSLCYQVPALCIERMTLVVSPLIALMQDQVSALRQAGVQAAALNSMQLPEEARDVFDWVRADACRILYVAPERLERPAFLKLMQEHPPALIAVDEAHCISQWGKDFRPSYSRIASFVDQLPARPPICAFTATATQRVADDIEVQLALSNPLKVRASFDRPNLSFEVRSFAGRSQRDKDRALLAIAKKHEGASGIVYCNTRNAVEEVGAYLRASGIDAVCYHGGMSDKARVAAQADFVYDRVPIVVATNAFGMGIDKSNVGFVVHYNMPLDLESYYQEAGRAGRDGSPAECVLLYSPKDVSMAQFLLNAGLTESAEIDGPTLRVLRERADERLRQMTFYCTTNDCLRGFILRYFGEQAPGYCGTCGNCLTVFEQRDATVAAQKIISCVLRLAQRNRAVGKTTIVGILRGSTSDKMVAQGYDTLSTYGIMDDTPAREVRFILDALIERGLLACSMGDYPVVTATQEGIDFLREGRDFVLKVPKPTKSQKAKERALKTQQAFADNAVDPELFDALRQLRARLASEAGVPAYVVFPDKTLADMCRRMPSTIPELLEVSGVGQVKAERYGEAFLSAINGGSAS